MVEAGVMGMEPLKYPTPWPPPVRERDRFDRIPLLGGLLRSIFTGSPHDTLLEGLLVQIVEQLKARTSPHPAWPNNPVEMEIVKALSKAIYEEKWIETAYLHPDDPLFLLWWGPFDDLTPLVFCIALQKNHLKGRLTREEILRCAFEGSSSGWNRHDPYWCPTTVREFTERLAEKVREVSLCQA